MFFFYYSLDSMLPSRGSQRDVVYLSWPIAPSYMSSNAGGGRGCGVSANEYRGCTTWTGYFKCREVKTGFYRIRSMQTGSSGTLIGWKSGQTTFVPLWDRMEGAWLRTPLCTWSINKLWRSNSIFNLCSLVLFIEGRHCFFKHWLRVSVTVGSRWDNDTGNRFLPFLFKIFSEELETNTKSSISQMRVRWTADLLAEKISVSLPRTLRCFKLFQIFGAYMQ
jgi:hypothetical protein